MKKAFASLNWQQKLILLVLIIALFPTIGVLGWGVYKSTQSAEFHDSWLAK